MPKNQSSSSSSESEDEQQSITQLTEEEYSMQLRSMLKRFLTEHVFYDIKPKTKALLTEEQMEKYWVKAFTHPTYSARNYETIETLGDRVLDLIVVDFLEKKYPNSGLERIISSVKSELTRNSFISKFSEKYGFNEFIRMYVNNKEGVYTPKEIPWKIMADVFEAVIGALWSAGNDIDTGLGLYYTQRWLFKLYDGHAKKLGDIVYGSYKTQVDQYFMFFKLTSGKSVRIVKSKESYVGTFSINADVVKFFAEYDIDLRKTKKNSDFVIVAEATGQTQKDVDTALYRRAYRFFKERGLTTPMAERIRNLRTFSKKMFRDYLDDLKEANSKNKYLTILFDDNSKSNTSEEFSVTLIGVKKNGTREPILTIRYKHSPEENRSNLVDKVKVELVKKYIQLTNDSKSKSKASSSRASSSRASSKKSRK